MRTPQGLFYDRHPTDIDKVIESFYRYRTEHPNGWAMWHSRLATQGRTTIENTHPYPIPGTDWVLAHNGILPLSDGPHKRDRSDSRILAEDYMSAESWADIFTARQEWEDWLDTNKVVLMTGRRQKGYPAVIILNEDLGYWIDGIWYSHKLYGYTRKVWSISGGYVKDATGTWVSTDDDDWQTWPSGPVVKRDEIEIETLPGYHSVSSHDLPVDAKGWDSPDDWSEWEAAQEVLAQDREQVRQNALALTEG